ncbi:MAG: alpha/beta hydrolase [Chloroflexi bacterium]|nr:alpha/beta hydrolase [Chloroflexota bacterium]
MNQRPRTYEQAKALLVERARSGRNPFDHVEPTEAEGILDRLTTLDHDTWAEAFMQAARPYEQAARDADNAGDHGTAIRNYMLAYGYYRLARYPCMNSDAKRTAYGKSQEMFLAAGKLMDPPVERVEMPGASGTVIGLLRVPPGGDRRSLVVAWGGIDSFKEERRLDPFLATGMAGLTIDMPGVADAPIVGSPTAERMFDAVFDWVEQEPRLDPNRIVLWGGSTGGYWAAKLAHTHRDRLAGVVEQGGPVHFAFQPEWIDRAQDGEYPFELAETLACAFGGRTFGDWLGIAPHLSLLDQGVLDQPCAPILCVNGLYDTVFPIADQYLLLEHGSPKTARLYPSGHMGHTATTMADITTWVRHIVA